MKLVRKFGILVVREGVGIPCIGSIPPLWMAFFFCWEFCLRGFEQIGILTPPLVSDEGFPIETATFFSWVRLWRVIYIG